MRVCQGAVVPGGGSGGGGNGNGNPLTSAGAIEAAADAGLVALVNLGPTAVIVGTISGR